MNRSTFDIVSSYQIDVNKCFDILFKIAFGNLFLKYGTRNIAGTIEKLERLDQPRPANVLQPESRFLTFWLEVI